MRLAAPASPRPRPAPQLQPRDWRGCKASRQAASPGACSSGGTWAFVHPESHGWGHGTNVARSARSRDRRIPLPTSPKIITVQCAPACSFQHRGLQGPRTVARMSRGDAGWGRVCTSFLGPGRPRAAAHHHKHMHPSTWSKSPLNPSRPTGKKKKFQESVQSRKKKVAHTPTL